MASAISSPTEAHPQPEEQARQYKQRSQWRMVWLQLKRDKAALLGLAIVAVALVLALVGPAIAPHDVTEQNLAMRRSGPSLAHPFGTDEFGRDIFSRILTGTRLTLGIAVLAVGIGAILGTGLGVVAGFYGDWRDRVVMGFTDTLLAFPYLLLAIVIAGVLGPSLRSAMIAVGIAAMPAYIRLTRAMTLSIKHNEYVLAAYTIGTPNSRIIFRHILPNVMGPLIVLATIGMANSILSTAALSFLGLGAQPPMPEWGAMLSSGRSHLLSAPHIATFPGLAIMVTMLGFNLLGDGFRDALDPRLRV